MSRKMWIAKLCDQHSYKADGAEMERRKTRWKNPKNSTLMAREEMGAKLLLLSQASIYCPAEIFMRSCQRKENFSLLRSSRPHATFSEDFVTQAKLQVEGLLYIQYIFYVTSQCILGPCLFLVTTKRLISQEVYKLIHNDEYAHLSITQLNIHNLLSWAMGTLAHNHSQNPKNCTNLFKSLIAQNYKEDILTAYFIALLVAQNQMTPQR